MKPPGSIHRIRKLRLEATASRRKEAFDLQQSLGFTVHTAAFRKGLEAVLDRLVPEGHFLKIDRLELHLDLSDAQAFQASFLDALTQTIRQRMEGSHPDRLHPVPMDVIVENALLAYLWFGSLPCSYMSVREQVLERIRSLSEAGNEGLIKRVVQSGATDPVVWKRLIDLMGLDKVKELLMRYYAFPARFFEAFATWPVNGTPVSNSTAGISPFGMSERNRYAYILQLLAEGWGEADILGLLQQLLPPLGRSVDGSLPVFTGRGDQLLTGLARQKEACREQLQQEGYAVLQAGMILIAPEAVKVLKFAQLVTQNNFPDSNAQQQAIMLLHFLCTGRITAEEDELLLSKILCGWPLHEPVDPDCAPGIAVQEEAEKCMEALLAGWKEKHPPTLHWLRMHFLSRSGRLRKREGEGWLLEVERKAEDIVFESPLMNKCLPGVVRLPWMHKIIFVRW